MARIVDVSLYKEHFVKMQGNKEYLPVYAQVQAAIDAGILLGVSTNIVETETHIRAEVTIKVLNKQVEGWEDLPEEVMIGYFDGVAETPKGLTGRSAPALFPTEVAETSALGRALSKLAINVNSMSSADEMRMIETKAEAGSGYSGKITADKIKELYAALKPTGVSSKEEADERSIALYKVPVNKLTEKQADEWIAKINVPF